MSVKTEIKGVKVVLKLAKGSQTIADCNENASDDGLMAVATAVSGLEEQQTKSVSKVVESTLAQM